MTLLVVNASEKGSQHYASHRENHREETRKCLVYTEFVYHHTCRILKERIDGCIEQQAQKGNHPECRILHHGDNVFPAKFVLRVAFGLLDSLLAYLGVESLVIDAVGQECKQTDSQQNQAYQHCDAHVAGASLDDARGQAVGKAGSESGESELQSHRESHFIAYEPFGYHLGSGNARYFRTYSVYAYAYYRNQNLRPQRVSQEIDGLHDRPAGNQRPQTEHRERQHTNAQHHKPRGHSACKANSFLVEYDSSEDEHKQIYVEDRIRAREGTVFAVAYLVCIALERGFNCKYVVRCHVGGKHHERNDEQYGPPCLFVVSKQIHCNSNG